MTDLEKALEKSSKLKLPQRLDKNRRVRNNESIISKKLFKKPYHLAVIMLNQGLMDGYGRMTQHDIAELFKKHGCDLTYQKVNHDLGFIAERLGIKDLIRSNVSVVKDGVRQIAPSTNPEQEDWSGWCMNCKVVFQPDERAKGCLCHKCLGTKPISKKAKKCQCGETFYETAKRIHVCQVCEARNKTFQESTLKTYYSGVM
jgi:ribosomal protein L9